MIGIALLIVVLLLMIMFTISAFLSSRRKQMNTLTKKELLETIETIKSEQSQITKKSE